MISSCVRLFIGVCSGALFAVLSFTRMLYHENSCFMASTELRNSRNTQTHRQCIWHSPLECSKLLLCKWASIYSFKLLCLHEYVRSNDMVRRVLKHTRRTRLGLNPLIFSNLLKMAPSHPFQFPCFRRKSQLSRPRIFPCTLQSPPHCKNKGSFLS